MRMLTAVACVVGCASDPTLHVTVTHPTGLAIASTTITVYESESLTCEDVEFARIGPTELDAAAVTSETIDAGGKTTGALAGISRTDHKVIVARGFDAAGKLLAAGCAEHEVIDGNVELPIATQVAVTASIIAPDQMSPDPSAAFVGAIDPNGKAIDGRPVSWTVYGPAGSQPVKMTGITMAGDGTWQPTLPTCTTGGLLKLHPIPPGVVGGFAVQMRVAWAQQLPAMYTTLTQGALTITPFTPPAGSTRFCAIRVSGTTHRLVCIDGGGTGVVARDYEVQAAGGAATLVERQNQVINPETIAVVAVPSGSDRDVYAVTIRGHLIELFGAPPANNLDPICPPTSCLTPVDDIIALPPCGAVPARLVLHAQNAVAAQLVQMNAHGGGAVTYPLPPASAGDTLAAFDRAGCIATFSAAGGTSTVKQALTLHMGRRVLGSFIPASTSISYDCTGTSSLACSVLPLAPGAGAGFTTGSEPRLIATSLDATGVVVLQLVLATDITGRDHYIERSRVPAASLPDHIVIGQFDTDSTTDMLWSVTTKRDTAASFEIAYARLAIDQPLEALSGPQPVVVSDILAGDLTGDGRDDVVVTGALTTGQTGLAVIPMDVPAAQATPAADPTCTP